jgi:hypothetical protein
MGATNLSASVLAFHWDVGLYCMVSTYVLAFRHFMGLYCMGSGSGFNPCASPYALAAMTSWGQPISTPMFSPSVGMWGSSAWGVA